MRRIAVLSIGIFFSFIVGLTNSLYHIITNRYIAYKMFRLTAFYLQKFLNSNILLFFSILIVLYIVTLLFSKRIKYNRDMRHLTVMAVIIMGVGLSIDRLLRYFIDYKIVSPFKKFIAVLKSLLTGRVSFNYFFNLLEKYIIVIAILAGSVIAIVFLYWLLEKIKWEKVSRIIETGYMRKTVLLLIASLVILNLYTVIDSKINTPKGPNVILIVVDTLRTDHLGSYGYNIDTSPNIDKLSQDSILFKNALSTAPWTTPSIGSMLTSQYPAVLGIKEEPVIIDNKFLFLPEIFKENNYKTKGIVSHALISGRLGFNQGFDSYDEGNAQGAGHISSPSITARAIAFVKKERRNRFFLFLHYFDPHYDYFLHEKYNYYPGYNGPFYSGQKIKILRGKAPTMSGDDIRYIKALHDSEISFTDEYIGKLLDKLKELGIYNNTLIVFTADHGEEFLERGDYWIGHARTLYQELIHVPLIIKLPGNSKKIIDEYVGLIDLMPTIINYAGLRIPSGYRHEGGPLDIKSMRGLEDKIIISDTKRWANLESVIQREWKFIYDPTEDVKKLFNLKRDPLESKNVAMENKEILKEMEMVLLEWEEQVNLKKLDKVQPAKFTQEQKRDLRSLGYLQ